MAYMLDSLLSKLGKKIKYILHIGTLKTGTTSLQNTFYDNYSLLKKNGILYPIDSVNPMRYDTGYKHQSLFNAIFRNDETLLCEFLNDVYSQIDDSTKYVLFSHEGFYHHLYDFTQETIELLRYIAMKLDLKLIVFFRPTCEYAESLYKQYLVNPPNVNNHYGIDLDIEDFLKINRIQLNYDYSESLHIYERIIRKQNIIVIKYKKNKTINQLVNLLGYTNLRLKPNNFMNSSLNNYLAILLKEINPYIINNKDRNIIINLFRKHSHNTGIESNLIKGRTIKKLKYYNKKNKNYLKHHYRRVPKKI